MSRHKHSDMMKIWAENTDLKVEIKCNDGRWDEVTNPVWNEETQYRFATPLDSEGNKLEIGREYECHCGCNQKFKIKEIDNKEAIVKYECGRFSLFSNIKNEKLTPVKDKFAAFPDFEFHDLNTMEILIYKEFIGYGFELPDGEIEININDKVYWEPRDNYAACSIDDSNAKHIQIIEPKWKVYKKKEPNMHVKIRCYDTYLKFCPICNGLIFE